MRGYGSLSRDCSVEDAGCSEEQAERRSLTPDDVETVSSPSLHAFFRSLLCITFVFIALLSCVAFIPLSSRPPLRLASIPIEASPASSLRHESSSPSDLPSRDESRFFNVLPWTEGAGGFEGVLEFCSDPDAEKSARYGYGLVGECVPGRPAPLIRMHPLRRYKLTLVNNADIDTNLHTHGLHISGVGTVDDITRNVEPGKCLQYEYYILDDADVGTFWYHPHRHPLVSKEAYGGAFGMLIVDETVRQFYPTHLENFLTRNEVLLQFGSMYSIKDKIRVNSVNGHGHLNLTIARGEYYYFRMSSVVFMDSINYVEFSPSDACEALPIARDGVYRSSVPANRSSHKFMVSLSSRLDLAVKCAQSSEIHFHQGDMSDESFMVLVNLLPSESLPASDAGSLMVPPVSPSSPYLDMELGTSWKPRRPYYMPNLSADTADEEWTVSMNNYLSDGTKAFNINDLQWDPNMPVRSFELGELVEINIVNSASHPYHVHINRAQIVRPGGCGCWYEEGEWYDTIAASDDNGGDLEGGCKVRTKLFDYGGRIILHCHRFGHEDKGMMTWIDVFGGPGHGMQGTEQVECSFL